MSHKLTINIIQEVNGTGTNIPLKRAKTLKKEKVNQLTQDLHEAEDVKKFLAKDIKKVQ